MPITDEDLELEDGELPDASAPPMPSRERSEPLRAGNGIPLPDLVEPQKDRLALLARGVIAQPRGGPAARAAALQYLQVLDGLEAASAPHARRMRCSEQLRDALVAVCRELDGARPPTSDPIRPTFMREVVRLARQHSAWLLAPGDAAALDAISEALDRQPSAAYAPPELPAPAEGDAAVFVRRAGEMVSTLPPSLRGGRASASSAPALGSHAAASSSASGELPDPDLKLELVLDLDHTCVHAAEMRGDSRVAAGVHTFLLSHGQGQAMGYKMRVREGLAAFLREVRPLIANC